MCSLIIIFAFEHINADCAEGWISNSQSNVNSLDK